MQIKQLHSFLFQSTLLALMVVLSISKPTFSQTVDYPFGVGGGINFVQYSGDLGSNFMKGGTANKGLNLYAGYYLNPSFDFIYNLDLAKVSFENQNVAPRNPVAGKRFENFIIGNSLQFRYKLANGYMFREDSDLDIFLSSGLSLFFSSDQIGGNRDTFGAIPMGIGFQLMLVPEWSINYQWTYFLTNNDSFDGFFEGQGNSINSRDHDDLLIQTLGVVWHFGQPSKIFVEADSDNDGVSDRLDKCPQIYGDVSRGGCPDKDNDGVPDFEDACPSAPGPASSGGCPDKDGDGIADSQDACPYVPGPAASNGCPDGDGDGVADYRDLCPDISAPGTSNGCPDGKRPGPPQPETQEPDADGDGIPDRVDNCPNTAGIAANGGCPEIDRSIEAALANIVKNIQFETASDRIARSSQTSLKQLVDILKKYPETKLMIEGHTDAAGNAGRNMKLSQRRADSVKKFLSDNGITASRLTAKGYGQTKPVATNDTAEGRAQNRRVDLKISY